jgi:hypothetical protein
MATPETNRQGLSGSDDTYVKHLYVREGSALYILPEDHPLAQSGDSIAPGDFHADLRKKTRESVRLAATKDLGGPALGMRAEMSAGIAQELEG